MNHITYKEWLSLSLYDELDESQKLYLDAHLASCTECCAELAELQKIHTLCDTHHPLAVNDALLREARLQLHGALRKELPEISLVAKISNYVWELFYPNYKLALGGVFTLTFGVSIGFLLFRTPSPENVQQQIIGTTTNGGKTFALPVSNMHAQNERRVSNIRFVDADASDGVVEFTFDAVTPVQMKGNVNDAQIQSILAQALLSEQNPGERLRTLSALAVKIENTQQQHRPDDEVKFSLIKAVKYDNNDGVRREALNLLLDFAMDDDIKNTLLYTLSNDENTGMRVTAIKGLERAKLDGHNLDSEALKVIQDRSTSDNNNFVRIRAKSVLQETK
ncbi:MAG: HEAT repeat domain-containing protein [Bacteroidota bacterium]